MKNFLAFFCFVVNEEMFQTFMFQVCSFRHFQSHSIFENLSVELLFMNLPQVFGHYVV